LASAAKVLNGLGIVYCDLGKQEQAMQCFQNASKLLRKSVRRKHVDVAGTLINLSTIHYDRKEVRLQKQTNQFAGCLSKRNVIINLEKAISQRNGNIITKTEIRTHQHAYSIV
jgi:tetratricopeptide (TPR) repeat protein